MTVKKKAEVAHPISETDVISWLTAHPDFLVSHTALLEHLLPPERELGDGISDFQRFQVQRLKGQIADMRATQQALITAGRANDMNLSRIHGAALRLTEAATLDELGRIIRDEIPQLCAVDRAVLGVEGDDLPASIATLAHGTIENWMGPADAMLRSYTIGFPELFDIDSAAMRSLAVIRLDPPGRMMNAVVAFGSHDPEWFTPDQATDLISFLGGIIARRLSALLPATQPANLS